MVMGKPDTSRIYQWLHSGTISNILYNKRVNNMKYTNLLLNIIFLVFLLHGCKSKIVDSDTSNSIKVIQPLTVGSEWHYKTFGFWPDGSNKDFISDYILKIKMDTIINGITWALIIRLPECDDCGFGEYLCNRTDGLWWGFPLEGDSLSWLRLPYPSRIGVEAINPYNEWWVENIDTIIKVPAGTFKCYHYKTKEIFGSQDLINDYFYSPGVGLVRLNWYTYANDTTIYMYLQRDLINYHIQ